LSNRSRIRRCSPREVNELRELPPPGKLHKECDCLARQPAPEDLLRRKMLGLADGRCGIADVAALSVSPA